MTANLTPYTTEELLAALAQRYDCVLFAGLRDHGAAIPDLAEIDCLATGDPEDRIDAHDHLTQYLALGDTALEDLETEGELWD